MLAMPQKHSLKLKASAWDVESLLEVMGAPRSALWGWEIALLQEGGAALNYCL